MGYTSEKGQYIRHSKYDRASICGYWLVRRREIAFHTIRRRVSPITLVEKGFWPRASVLKPNRDTPDLRGKNATAMSEIIQIAEISMDSKFIAYAPEPGLLLERVHACTAGLRARTGRRLFFVLDTFTTWFGGLYRGPANFCVSASTGEIHAQV